MAINDQPGPQGGRAERYPPYVSYLHHMRRKAPAAFPPLLRSHRQFGLFQQLAEQKMTPSLMSVANLVFGQSLAVLCVFEGVRRTTLHGRSRFTVGAIVFGILFCGTEAGLGVMERNAQHGLSAALRVGVVVPDTPADWGANFTPQQIAALSLDLAQGDFQEHGHLRHYLDESGKQIMYVPGEAEVEKRAAKLARLAMGDEIADMKAAASVAWLCACFAAGVLGFVCARMESKRLLAASTP